MSYVNCATRAQSHDQDHQLPAHRWRSSGPPQPVQRFASPLSRRVQAHNRRPAQRLDNRFVSCRPKTNLFWPMQRPTLAPRHRMRNFSSRILHSLVRCPSQLSMWATLLARQISAASRSIWRPPIPSSPSKERSHPLLFGIACYLASKSGIGHCARAAPFSPSPSPFCSCGALGVPAIDRSAHLQLRQSDLHASFRPRSGRFNPFQSLGKLLRVGR